jgi:hypothetical protein
MLKIPVKYEKHISTAKSTATSLQVSPYSLLGVCWYFPEEPWWLNEE